MVTTAQQTKQALEKSLQRRGLYKPKTQSSDTLVIRQFRNKPFYIADKSLHDIEFKRTGGKCCHWHIVGAPLKNGIPMDCFDYQLEIINYLESVPHNTPALAAVCKCRASGITELALRYMSHLCLKDSRLSGSKMLIISAPSFDLSVGFIKRMRAFYEPLGASFDMKESIIELGDGPKGPVTISALPSHNLKRIRGEENISFALVEEADHWPASEQVEIMPLLMPLIAKTPSMKILAVSTPGPLNGLMEKISKDSKSPFRKFFIPYTRCINRIFTQAEIDHQKISNPQFEREMNLRWGYGLGNIVSPYLVNRATELGKWYANPKTSPDPLKRPYPSIYKEAESYLIGVDPGAGSSKFAITLLQVWDGLVHTTCCEEYARPLEDDMVSRILELLRLTRYKARIYCDAANPSFIRKIKSMLAARGERVDYENQITELRKQYKYFLQYIEHYMIIIPINFSTEGPRLLQTAATYLQRELVVIEPSLFPALVQQLQSAKTVDSGRTDWALDKSQNSMDALDSFRLACAGLMVERQRGDLNTTTTMSIADATTTTASAPAATAAN